MLSCLSDLRDHLGTRMILVIARDGSTLTWPSLLGLVIFGQERPWDEDRQQG